MGYTEDHFYEKMVEIGRNMDETSTSYYQLLKRIERAFSTIHDKKDEEDERVVGPFLPSETGFIK